MHSCARKNCDDRNLVPQRHSGRHVRAGTFYRRDAGRFGRRHGASLLPAFDGDHLHFRIVGMGTFFAGFLRVPITSLFMVVELSGNYSAALPVMVSSLIAYVISRKFQEVPLFDMLTRQDGLLLPSIEERREQVSLIAEDAMQVDTAIVADAGEPVSLLAARIDKLPDSPLLIRVRAGEWRIPDARRYSPHRCRSFRNTQRRRRSFQRTAADGFSR